MTFVPVGDRPGGAEVWVVRADDGRRFAVFALDDGLRVTDVACPHNRGPLAQGWVRDGHVLTCPWHWYRYDLDTGDCLTQPAYHLGTYPVVEHDGRLCADVGEKPDPVSMAQRLRAHARGEDTQP